MTTRLFIDPGLRGLGAALFSKEGTARRAVYIENPVASGRGYEVYAALAKAVAVEFSPYIVHELHIEMPLIYGTVHKKGDPNDVVDCVAVGAAVAVALQEQDCGPFRVFSVPPSSWKGQLEKKAMTERIISKLTEEEVDLVAREKANFATPVSLMHNVYDALGIGLHYFGRLNKKVYPGAAP